MATDAIITAARGWIGTPYHHQASTKGAGCDCLGLLRGVWRELRGDEPEIVPPYAPDWALATGAETLRDGFARHLTPIPLNAILPGDVVLFRMARLYGLRASARGAARHCGILGCATASLLERGLAPNNNGLTLIHARQNAAVREESFTAFWRSRLAFAFRL